MRLSLCHNGLKVELPQKHLTRESNRTDSHFYALFIHLFAINQRELISGNSFGIPIQAEVRSTSLSWCPIRFERPWLWDLLSCIKADRVPTIFLTLFYGGSSGIPWSHAWHHSHSCDSRYSISMRTMCHSRYSSYGYSSHSYQMYFVFVLFSASLFLFLLGISLFVCIHVIAITTFSKIGHSIIASFLFLLSLISGLLILLCS